MNDLILLYFLGAAIVSNIILIWMETNLPVHFYDLKNFFNKKKKKLFTRNEWEDHVMLRCGYFGELITCPLCLATHLSWLTGLIIYLICDCSPLLILSGAFSWPIFSYFFYKKISS
jgi:hypothetical protein